MVGSACGSILLAALLTVGPLAFTAQLPTAAPQPAQNDAAKSRPKVRLIATGGTISNRVGGRLSADELLQSIPTLDRYVRADAEQFANVSSSSLTLAQWLDLARRINAVLRDDAELAGIVVTSGTDTLEETAYFLNLTVRTDKPVVVVGSMRNPSTLGYEGAANLLAGFRVAAEPASRGKGVLVVLNDEINAARDVAKTDSLRLDTFRSRGFGPLGTVDSDRVIYYRAPTRRHTAGSEFDVFRVKSLPRVDVVLVYQDASGDVIKAIVDLGAQGIVIGAAGAGAMSGTQAEGVDYAMNKHVVVVTTTRAGSGRIPGRTNPSASSGGRGQPRSRISGDDLSPVKARVLLMLALTVTRDAAEIQRMFLEY
jgi:L-asparaginase